MSTPLSTRRRGLLARSATLLRQLAVVCTAALTPLFAQAGALYQYTGTIGGDTVWLTTINDLGQVVMGTGQGCNGPCSFITSMGGGGFTGHVTGLPLPGAPNGTESGTMIGNINSAGDMIGVSGFGGFFGIPNPIPTFWRNGVAYDMRDPANSGLVFVPDPGVSFGSIDLGALDIINPGDFAANFGFGIDDAAAFLKGSVSGWRNAKNQFAFEAGWNRPTHFFVPIPTPPTLALVALALAAGAAVRWRRASALPRASCTASSLVSGFSQA